MANIVAAMERYVAPQKRTHKEILAMRTAEVRREICADCLSAWERLDISNRNGRPVEQRPSHCCTHTPNYTHNQLQTQPRT